ncbi:MAG TPA: cellulase family glycosylhydrolase [Candidatus Marinimicrobia bacterium]|nr:cellulase family glycosylhydrolase [Candidatus Neomarinimicrobiota bacterium]
MNSVQRHNRHKCKIITVFWLIVILPILIQCEQNNKSDQIGGSELTFVEEHGSLTVSGNRIIDQNGDPIVLRGMSLFWSQWMGKYYNYNCIKWLRDDWKCTVVRAAMGIESGGYLNNPASEKAKIVTVIEACIDLGIYVIVDWHDHNAHEHQAQAIAFFQEIATDYGAYPNVIYEVFNEPEQDNWKTVLKPYLNAVVDSIRAIDPDNLIVAGTPTWSQDVDVASLNPLAQNNIAYALHFYAAYQYHKQTLRNKASTALNNGIALFVTEFGTVMNTGDGPIDTAETRLWMNFMESNQISWCNWSIADKNETSAALKPGASANGGWSVSEITESGLLIRDYIIRGNTKQPNLVTKTRLIPDGFALAQNYPNPFNSSTQISFELPVSASVNLGVYDLRGNLICTLLNKVFPAGRYQTTWETNGAIDEIAGGVYILQFLADSEIGTTQISRKLSLIK